MRRTARAIHLRLWRLKVRLKRAVRLDRPPDHRSEPATFRRAPSSLRGRGSRGRAGPARSGDAVPSHVGRPDGVGPRLPGRGVLGAPGRAHRSGPAIGIDEHPSWAGGKPAGSAKRFQLIASPAGQLNLAPASVCNPLRQLPPPADAGARRERARSMRGGSEAWWLADRAHSAGYGGGSDSRARTFRGSVPSPVGRRS